MRILLVVNLTEGGIDNVLLNAFALEHEGQLKSSPAVKAQLVAAVGTRITPVVEESFLLEPLDDGIGVGRGNAPFV